MDIPNHLLPNKSDDNHQVSVESAPKHDFTPEQVNKAFETLGIVKLHAEQVMALRDLGIFAKQLGIMEVMHGGVMVTQQHLIDMMTKVRNIAEKEDVSAKEVKDCAKVVGYLAGQFGKLVSSSMKSETVVVEKAMQDDKLKRASFPSGRVNARAVIRQQTTVIETSQA
jgi:hypothetical protein